MPEMGFAGRFTLSHVVQVPVAASQVPALVVRARRNRPLPAGSTSTPAAPSTPGWSALHSASLRPYVDLVQEGFDLAVRAGALADTSLLARRLGVSDLGLFASPAYLKRAGRPRKPADLAGHECVLYRAAEGNSTWKLSGPGGQVEVSVRGRATTDERAFVRGMLLADFGIGLVPVPLVSALVRSGQLERVLPRWASRGTPLHLVWPSRRFEPIAVARYREALAEALPHALGAALRE